MRQTLTVIEIKGKQAVLSGERASACGSCVGKTSCSTLGSWKQRKAVICIENSLHADVGEQVVIEVPEHWLIKVAFRLYGLPMLGFLAGGSSGLWLASWLHGATELYSALGGIIGAVVVYALLWGSDEQMDAKMVAIEYETKVEADRV